MMDQPKKTPQIISKWLTDYKSSPQPEYIEFLYSNKKLLEEINHIISRGSNYLNLQEVCQHIITLYISEIKEFRFYAACLIPFLLESFILNVTTSEYTSKKGQQSHKNEDFNRVNHFATLESCITTIISKSKKLSPNLECDFSFLTRSIYHENVDLKKNYGHSLSDIPKPPKSGVMNNIHSFIANLLDVYANEVIDKSNRVKDECGIYSTSVSVILNVIKKIVNFTENVYVYHNAQLLIDFLNFIDTFLFSIHTSLQDKQLFEQFRSISVDNLMSIETLATYYCYTNVLLLCNSLINLWTKSLGDLNDFLLDYPLNRQAQNVSVRAAKRMSLFEENIDLENHSPEKVLDSERQGSGFKMAKARGLSTCGVITNANFKPEIVPEDITVEATESKDEH